MPVGIAWPEGLLAVIILIATSKEREKSTTPVRFSILCLKPDFVAFDHAIN